MSGCSPVKGSRAVHPRTRGEHVCLRASRFSLIGSSPHTRGTWHRSRRPWPRTRFIPAHAGNIGWSAGEHPMNAVHPRTRGEHRRQRSRKNCMDGSSPHTRGTYTDTLFADESRRFIPAHAGNIPGTRPPARSAPVHPRTRGEHDQPRALPGSVVGSSPHTRGTLTARTGEARPERFIPAHAGNITAPVTTRDLTSVHPRTRGEHSKAGMTTSLVSGSSPHTRGTSAISASVFFRSAVHPRTRGEHQPRRQVGYGNGGSSPHTRGTSG